MSWSVAQHITASWKESYEAARQRVSEMLQRLGSGPGGSISGAFSRISAFSYTSDATHMLHQDSRTDRSQILKLG